MADKETRKLQISTDGLNNRLITSAPNVTKILSILTTQAFAEISGSGSQDQSSLPPNQASVQLLIPICSAVVLVVVFITAACFMTRPRNAGRRQEQSVYSMETSHDTLDYGIYDVIDEVISTGGQKVDHLPSDRPLISRRDRQLPSLHVIKEESFMLNKKLPHFHVFEKRERQVHCISSKSSEGQLGKSLRLDTNLHKLETKIESASEDTEGAKELNNDFTTLSENQNDRDYETLDKYWKAKLSASSYDETGDVKAGALNEQSQPSQSSEKTKSASCTNKSSFCSSQVVNDNILVCREMLNANITTESIESGTQRQFLLFICLEDENQLLRASKIYNVGSFPQLDQLNITGILDSRLLLLPLSATHTGGPALTMENTKQIFLEPVPDNVQVQKSAQVSTVDRRCICCHKQHKDYPTNDANIYCKPNINLKSTDINQTCYSHRHKPISSQTNGACRPVCSRHNKPLGKRGPLPPIPSSALPDPHQSDWKDSQRFYQGGAHSNKYPQPKLEGSTLEGSQLTARHACHTYMVSDIIQRSPSPRKSKLFGEVYRFQTISFLSRHSNLYH